MSDNQAKLQSRNWKKEFSAVLAEHTIERDKCEFFIKNFHRWRGTDEMEQQCAKLTKNVENLEKSSEVSQELTLIFEKFLEYRDWWLNEFEKVGVGQEKTRLSRMLRCFAVGHAAVKAYCSSKEFEAEKSIGIDIDEVRGVISKNSCSEEQNECS